MAFFVQAENLMTLFLGLEWFSIALYVLCALDTNRAKSLEAGLKYLIIGGFGSAILLFGSALVYGATGQLGFHEIAASGKAHDPLLVVGLALILDRDGVQGIRGAVPHVDTGRLRGRADPGDGVHVGGDEGGGLRRPLPHPDDRVPGEPSALDDRDRRARLRVARDREPRRARADATSSACSRTRRSRTPASC